MNPGATITGKIPLVCSRCRRTYGETVCTVPQFIEAQAASHGFCPDCAPLEIERVHREIQQIDRLGGIV